MASKDHDLQTRHLVTNTLFDAAEDGKTVKTKSTVLVTLQASNLEAPELDYSADVRATLAKDGDGKWKFQSLTVYADNAAIVAKKR
jgi:SnoaL-like protein